MTEITMEKIVSWAKRRGFVFPSSEIYGGFSSSYDYGPLGVELINNIKNLWWQKMVHEREDVEGIDGAIITHPKVWEASGHVENFTDPLVDCRSCKKRFRADKILEDKFGVERVAGKSLAEIGEMLREEEVPCPHCGLVDWTDVRKFNLLLETNIGVTEEDRKKIYLRGETCQTIYLNWENVLNTSRQKLPFGIAQIGKAFRNEITPGNFIFRTREFEQMEMQYFVSPESADSWYEYWKNERTKYMIEEIGLNKDKLHLRQHAKDERAHYAKDAFDLEYNTPWGWWEFEGLHHRGDWDLSRHGMFSGKKIEYFDQEMNKKYIPWVIETSGGVGRLALVTMLDAYTEEEIANGKEKEVRVVMKFGKKIAPIKVAVLPLMKKENLVEFARKIFDKLKKKYVCQFDLTQSIGKRYRRQDEIGTPYCVTVDFDSLDDNMVTVRERDSMQQSRIEIAKLDDFLSENLG
ncbi:MAG: glycine--tRNA ligase [Patescibacteria group bacterium]